MYERTVPDGRFLRQLEVIVHLDVLYEKLVQLHRGKAQMVSLPCNSSVILKMLILAYLHDLPERPTDAFANDSLSDKYFPGVAVDKPAPDHSALTAFKRRGGTPGRVSHLLRGWSECDIMEVPEAW